MVSEHSSQLAAIENPRLNLAEYRALVGQLPPPNHAQVEAFAAYVSTAKSWYKHLRLWPPGQPFLFYIDPHVGMDCIVDASGGVTYLPRTKATPQSHRFHHTWMTTEDYQTQFGSLAFACNAGSLLMLPVTVQRPDRKAVSGLLDNNPSRSTVLTEDREFDLPDEVIDVGTVCLTGVIHDTASEPWIWLRRLNQAETIPWPEESGGRETGANIVQRCRLLQKESRVQGADEVLNLIEPERPDGRRSRADEQLHNLIEPERVRQRTEMIVAIQAVIDLVYGKAV